MFDREKLDPEARELFDSMPMLLQENLMQTGVELRTLQDLQRYCDGILASK